MPRKNKTEKRLITASLYFGLAAGAFFVSEYSYSFDYWTSNNEEKIYLDLQAKDIVSNNPHIKRIADNTYKLHTGAKLSLSPVSTMQINDCVRRAIAQGQMRGSSLNKHPSETFMATCLSHKQTAASVSNKIALVMLAGAAVLAFARSRQKRAKKAIPVYYPTHETMDANGERITNTTLVYELRPK